MTNLLTIDFETRSEAALKKVGVTKYSKDPSTEVLCMAHQLNDTATGLYAWERQPCEFPTFAQIDKDMFLNTDVEAHNAGFEYALYHNCLMPRYDLPPIPQHRWYCSMAKCARLGIPAGLGGACAALNVEVQKDTEGHKLMLKLCKPRPAWVRNGTGAKWFGTPEEFARLFAYCITDVQAEHALSRRVSIWAFEQGIV